MKPIKLSPVVPITNEQTTIKRNNVHFYYILMISPLPIYVQPSENILATGISRDSLYTTL